MPQQLINILLNLLIYSDGKQSSAPSLRDVDYNRQLIGIPTGNSFTQRFSIPPASTLTVADMARTLTQDATTEYTVELVEGSTFRYRHTAGTSPGLRFQ